MRYLKLYNESKKDWAKMVNDLTFGYYNQVVQENGLSDMIEEVKDVVLPISDLSEGTELFYDIYFDSKGFPARQTTYITLPDGANKLVTGLHITEFVTYSQWKEVSSKLVKIVGHTSAWFGITLIFKQGRHYYSSGTNKIKKSQTKKEFRDIKLGLQSRGWTINQHGLGDDSLFTAAGEFSFSILMPISIVESNNWLISSGLLNESKLAIFEELKDDTILQDTKDILLEWSDEGNQIKIDWVDSRYKDEVVIIIKNETGNLDVETFIRLFNYMKENGYICDTINCFNQETSHVYQEMVDKIYILQYAKDFNLPMDIDTINYYLGLELVFHKMKSAK